MSKEYYPPTQLEEGQDLKYKNSILLYDFNLSGDSKTQIQNIIEGLYDYLKNNIQLPGKYYIHDESEDYESEDNELIVNRRFIQFDSRIINNKIIFIFTIMSLCWGIGDDEIEWRDYELKTFLDYRADRDVDIESYTIQNSSDDPIELIDNDKILPKCFTCHQHGCANDWNDINCTDDHILDDKLSLKKNCNSDDEDVGLVFVKNAGEDLYDFILKIKSGKITKENFYSIFNILLNDLWEINKEYEENEEYEEEEDRYDVGLVCHNTNTSFLHFKHLTAPIPKPGEITSHDFSPGMIWSDNIKEYINKIIWHSEPEGAAKHFYPAGFKLHYPESVQSGGKNNIYNLYKVIRVFK